MRCDNESRVPDGRCLGQAWAGEGRRGGSGPAEAAASPPGPAALRLLRRLGLALRGQQPAAEESFPPQHGRLFREEQHYGKLRGSQSRYNCYGTIIVDAETETACTGSGFNVWFLEEHGCTLNSKTCVYFPRMIFDEFIPNAFVKRPTDTT